MDNPHRRCLGGSARDDEREQARRIYLGAIAKIRGQDEVRI